MKSLLALLLLPLVAHAKLIKDVNYEQNGTQYKGYLVYDDSKHEPQPGILVVHNWMGVTDETKSKADALAALGYVAFAADIYGVGQLPKDSKEAGVLATRYKSDRQSFRQHLQLGVEQLKKQKNVNPAKLAAVGYCFGGTGVIELARSGSPLKGVVSFHGGLDSPKPSDGQNIHARVLALHGADDPYEKREDLEAFENEMRTNKVDWRLIKYGNAVHSFTEKAAGHDNSKGAAYNEAADRRSWQDMKTFLKEIF